MGDLPLTLVLFWQFIAVDGVDEHAIDDSFSLIVVNLVHLRIAKKWGPAFHAVSRGFSQVYTHTESSMKNGWKTTRKKSGKMKEETNKKPDLLVSWG